MIFLTILQNIVIFLIDAVVAAMLIRAILSWVDPDEEWKITFFLYCITEPLVQPVRNLCEKKHWFERSPLDVPFYLTEVILIFLQSLVYML